MKHMLAVLIVVLLSTFLTMEAFATDEDDVIAASKGLIAALNNWDGDAWIQYFMEGYDHFGQGGGLLNEVYNPTAEKEGFVKAKESGAKYNVQWRHLSAKIYGNTAVLTGYFVGTYTNAEGTPKSINVRSSGVWLKQGGKWKIVHYHNSDLLPASSQ